MLKYAARMALMLLLSVAVGAVVQTARAPTAGAQTAELPPAERVGEPARRGDPQYGDAGYGDPYGNTQLGGPQAGAPQSATSHAEAIRAASQAATGWPRFQQQQAPPDPARSATPHDAASQHVETAAYVVPDSRAADSRAADTAKPEAAPSPAKADAESPLPLAPRNERRKLETTGPQTPTGAMLTVTGSLAVVLGLFFTVVWITRRALPRAATSLPGEVVEVLGRTPLSGRQNMHLIRIGGKLLLVSVTATGAETLTEVTDPGEVERIAGLCKQGQAGSVTATFRQVLSQIGSEPAQRGFLGDAARDDRPTAARNGAQRRRSPDSADA